MFFTYSDIAKCSHLRQTLVLDGKEAQNERCPSEKGSIASYPSNNGAYFSENLSISILKSDAVIVS